MVESPEQCVKHLIEDLIKRWLIEKDQNALIDKLSDQCSWINEDTNRILMTKKDILQFFEEYYVTLYDKLNICFIKDLIVRAAGNQAVVIIEIPICYYAQTAKQIQTSLMFTMILQKENEIWKILHLHDSLTPGKEYKNREIDARQTVSEREKLASQTDSVTGILNMDGFCDRVSQLLKKNNQRYALIKFSIKDFRYINLRYGYSMGDIVLQNIGKNLDQSCMEEETCGRIEKDMFAMLYKYKNKRDMSERLEEVRKRLLDKNLLYELGIQIDFIAGIYIIPKSRREHIKDMLDKALMVLQQVDRHQNGSHYLYYDDNMMKKQIFHHQIIRHASTALKNEEFQLYIQPQFDIGSCEVIAGEALCRWEKEKGVFIAPDEFIPLFEDYGVILELDFYMLRKLCEKMWEWMQAGRIIKPISINQSRLHIEKEDYIEEFCKVVDEYGIPHHYIAFELTESVFVEKYEHMIKLAKELHENGFQLSIDDFGTGFASLNLLSVVSADILKIDKNLLDSIYTKRGKTVLQKVIELAHQMEMKVICEGIEEREQLKELQELGCDWGQGYLVGKPIPAEEFEKIWIESVQEVT